MSDYFPSFISNRSKKSPQGPHQRKSNQEKYNRKLEDSQSEYQSRISHWCSVYVQSSWETEECQRVSSLVPDHRFIKWIINVDLHSWMQNTETNTHCHRCWPPQRSVSHRITIDFPVIINTKIIGRRMIKCRCPQTFPHNGVPEPARVTMATLAVWQSPWQIQIHL